MIDLCSCCNVALELMLELLLYVCIKVIYHLCAAT